MAQLSFWIAYKGMTLYTRAFLNTQDREFNEQEKTNNLDTKHRCFCELESENKPSGNR